MEKKKIIWVVIGVLIILIGILLINIGTNDNSVEVNHDSITQEDIDKAEELFKKGSENQLPIEEQIEELRRIELKLYGKEISDYDSIRDK